MKKIPFAPPTDIKIATTDPAYARLVFQSLGIDTGELEATRLQDLHRGLAYGVFISEDGDVYVIMYYAYMLPDQCIKLMGDMERLMIDGLRKKLGKFPATAKEHFVAFTLIDKMEGFAATEYCTMHMPMYPPTWAERADIKGNRLDIGHRYVVCYGQDVKTIAEMANRMGRARYGDRYPVIELM